MTQTSSQPSAAPGRGTGDHPLLRRIRESVIGEDHVMTTPYGERRVTYADYTASGRALTFIEDAIRDVVLPSYANTHTESSGTGLQTTRLREDARAAIHTALGGDDDTVVIFTGSGCTGAIAKLVGVLGLRIPSALEDAHQLSRHIPAEQRPVVLIGPFEHHSNEIPWRESIADVVEVAMDADGHVCADDLRAQLERYADRPLVIGSFSAASNVTGIISDTHAITELLHEHDALAFWDFAAAGPYVDIEMNPPGRPEAYKDAVFLSPHKFIGGPSTPGVLAARRELFTNRVPDVPGGGTVAYVNPAEHSYLADPAHREEGGTPAIVEAVRAGLVFRLKEAVGVDTIRAREDEFLRRAVEAWEGEPGLEILGNLDAERLSILSFVVRGRDRSYLHHNFVVAVLNDLFGIQARGGCSCAGPYGHRLLGIDLERSHAFEREISGGCEGIKPGWVRVNFNYFISDAVADYVIEAVRMVARDGWRLLGDYSFDPDSGLWRHRDGVVEPPVRLPDIAFGADGSVTLPEPGPTGGEELLEQHLAEAREILAAAQVAGAAGSAGAAGGAEAAAPAGAADAVQAAEDAARSLPPAGLSEDFEALRWFDLPASVKVGPRA